MAGISSTTTLLTGIIFSFSVLNAQNNLSCIPDNTPVYDHESDYLSTKEAKYDSIIILVRALLFAFTELDSVNIQLKQKRIRTLAVARPKADFLFHIKAKRTYNIIISSNSKYQADSLLIYMPCRAFTGLIAHELSHIVKYNELNGIALALYGIKYPFKKREIERSTDKVVIDKGYGMELLHLYNYIQTSPFTHSKYLKNKNKNYLSVDEIIHLSNDKVF